LFGKHGNVKELTKSQGNFSEVSGKKHFFVEFALTFVVYELLALTVVANNNCSEQAFDVQ